MKTLTTLLMMFSLSLPLQGQQNLPLGNLLDLVSGQFNKQAQTLSKTSNGVKLHWKFIDYNRFPFGCANFNFGRDSSEVVWIWRAGPVIALKKSAEIKAQVGVFSFIGEDKHPKYRNYQMFFYSLNSEGAWFQYQTSFIQVETWNDSLNMYICGRE